MANIKFSQGRSKYDNQPAQLEANDFDDFVAQISSTGSTRKGLAYICAPMAKGAHTEPDKNPGDAHWRIRNLAMSRRFLALDGDGFSSPSVLTEFQQLILY